MSVKAPSLFDDFFSEEEKKEELFPDIPHVYDPEENKENEVNEQEPFIPGIEEHIDEALENSTEQEIGEKKETEIIEDKVISSSLELNIKNTKKPTLELPEQTELDKQLMQELISTDYTSFIHRDYPFNPIEIEMVASKEVLSNEEGIEAQKEENEILQIVKVKEQNKKYGQEEEEKQGDINYEKENSEESPILPLPEWELTKKYYPIGEVAKLFDVNISHIRFWTNEFKLNPRTTRKGDRLYAPEQINELKLIHYLVKVKKHTIKGAREKMKNQKETVGNNLKLKESLTELRDLLLNIQSSI